MIRSIINQLFRGRHPLNGLKTSRSPPIGLSKLSSIEGIFPNGPQFPRSINFCPINGHPHKPQARYGLTWSAIFHAKNPGHDGPLAKHSKAPPASQRSHPPYQPIQSVLESPRNPMGIFGTRYQDPIGSLDGFPEPGHDQWLVPLEIRIEMRQFAQAFKKIYNHSMRGQPSRGLEKDFIRGGFSQTSGNSKDVQNCPWPIFL